MNRFVDRRIVVALAAVLAAACGHSSPSAPSIVAQPTPQATQASATVSSVLPATLPPSASMQTLVVEGTNFQPGLTVIFSQAGASTAHASPHSTQSITGTDVQNLTSTSFNVNVMVSGAGSYVLQVVNPSASPSAPSTVIADPSLSSNPTIAGLSPRSPAPGTAPTPVYVVGTNFVAGLSVQLTFPDGSTTTLGGTAITFGSSTIIQMRPSLSQSGTYSLRVVNPSGASSDAFSFEVSTPTPPTPAVTGVSPLPLTAGTPIQHIYISGSGFQAGLSVALTRPDGSATTVANGDVSFGTSTAFAINVVLPVAGSYSVVVTDPSGLSSTPFAFTIQAPSPTPSAPTIAGLSPRSPTMNSAVQKVYVGGANFQSGLAVAITAPDGSTSSVSGSAVTFGTSTAFSMNVTLATAGAYSLVVTNPSGASSASFPFTVQTPAPPVAPTITSISPGSPVAGSATQSVSVNGTGFQSLGTVTLTMPDGTSMPLSPTAITWTSSSAFKMSVVLGTVGTYGVQITNPTGLSSGVLSFAVVAAAPPTVTGTSPQTPTAGTPVQGVYVAGTGFETGLSVTLTVPGGATSTISGSAITVGSSTIFKMNVVLPVPGAYTFVVNNPSGLSSAPASLTVGGGA
jgi:hypothetical protein